MDNIELVLDRQDLLDYILSEEWQKNFSVPTLTRAESYASPAYIISSEITVDEDEDVIIEATVRGSGRRYYDAEVTFFWDLEDQRVDLDTSCSCPVSEDCKHCAAIIIQLIKTITEHVPNNAAQAPIHRHDPHLSIWLNNLKKFTQPQKNSPNRSKPNIQFLAYCLSPKGEYTDNPTLNLRIGRNLKSGSVIDTFTTPTATPSKPAGYMSKDDIYPCTLYHQQVGKYYDSQLELNTPAAAGFLKEALKTKRLFLITATYETKHPTIPITKGKKISAQLSWKTHGNGSASPTLGLEQHQLLIPTTPPYLLNLKRNTLHRYHHSEYPPDLILNWENGLQIPAQNIATIVPELAKINLPEPREIKIEKLPKSTPVPVLTLTRKNPFTHAGLHFSGQPKPIIASISFLYHGHVYTPKLAGGAFDTNTFTVSLDNTLLEIERDSTAEESFVIKLMQQWHIVPCHLIDKAVRPDSSSSFLPREEVQLWEHVWASFILNGIPKLEKEGWKITVKTKAQVNVHKIHPDSLGTGLDELPDHGIDWFQFKFSYLTPEGEEHSLIPIITPILENIEIDELAGAIEELNDQETTIVKHPITGTFISIPTKQLYTLAKNIYDLFGERSPEEPLHRIQAAGIADQLKLDSSETLRALAKLGNNLGNITTLPKPKPPASLKAELRDYQLDGFHWLQFLARHSLHGILADDMGLGKTLQTLTHIQAEVSSRRTQNNPSLVIAPTSVVGNWQAEAKKFTPRLKVLLLHGAERKDKFHTIADHHLILTTYSLLVRDFDILKEHHFHIIALDEAQYIKNHASKASQLACQLPSTHRVSLSGTPIENHLGELWSQMRFLMPGILGSLEQFRKHFRTPIEKHHNPDAQAALNRRIAPLILRRTKDEVATELPPKTHILHTIPLNAEQIDIYETVRASMDERVRDAIANKGLAKSQIIVLDALLKLRQICCHPKLLKIPAAQKITHSAKLDFLTNELLPTLLDEGRKILLFSTFTSMLKLIEDHLNKQQIPYAKITGNTKNRQQQIELFQNGEAPIFIISLKAGGTGLNLTAADTVIHYDPWWNPAAENQATDRAHRIGQTKPVFVHKLIAEGTIEQRIQELQAKKSALVDALLTSDTTRLKIDSSTLNNLLAPLT